MTAFGRRRLGRKSWRSFQGEQRKEVSRKPFAVGRGKRRTANGERLTSNGEDMADHKTGKVIQIIGPAVDIEFEEGHLPSIYNAIRIVDNGELGKVPIDVVAEVANHIGENQVRCIAMKPTDGMVRGMKAIDQ